MDNSFQRQRSDLNIFIGLYICGALVIANPLNAGLVGDISVEISPTSAGEFRYEYLIENFPESTVSINTFVLDVGDGADLHSFEGPANWTEDYNPNEDSFELAWISNSSGYDIPIGGSSTFVFESPLDAAMLPYFVAKLDFNGSDLGSLFGDINAPAVVPTPELHADFDENNMVNGADLLLWQTGFGTTSGATLSIGDANTDGDVDGSDFLIWQQQFGTATTSLGNATVPEPASVALLIAFSILTLAHCRRRRS